MNFTGFLCEYNPFHSGHARHARLSREFGDPCVCVMSGCFVQRGEAAVADPWTRAQAAMDSGCDLVVMLPAFYALQPGEYFAKGAMTLLSHLGASRITFGSPVQDQSQMEHIARLMAGEAFSQMLKKHLNTGVSYPRAMEEAIRELSPEAGDAAHEILSSANATLGLEYLRALKEAGFTGDISILDRPRDSLSATAIRQELRSENRADYLRGNGQQDLPETMRNALQGNVIRNDALGTLFAYYARNHGEISLPDDGEGIANRLLSTGRKHATWEGILEAAKTKRYTRARLQRAILHALLGIEDRTCRTLREHLPLYLYPLALNEKGTDLIRAFKKESPIPVIDRPAAFEPRDPATQSLWEIDRRAMELYEILDPNLQPGALFTHPVIRKKG